MAKKVDAQSHLLMGINIKITETDKLNDYQKKVVRQLIQEASVESRAIRGNRVEHIQKQPIARYEVYERWNLVYEVQYRNGSMTKKDIAQAILDEIEFECQGITVGTILYLLNDNRINDYKRESERLMGRVDESNIDDGLLKFLEI